MKLSGPRQGNVGAGGVWMLLRRGVLGSIKEPGGSRCELREAMQINNGDRMNGGGTGVGFAGRRIARYEGGGACARRCKTKKGNTNRRTNEYNRIQVVKLSISKANGS